MALRPWRSSDLEPVVAAVQDPAVPRFTAVPSPYREREGREFLSAVEPERRAGRHLSLAIDDAGSGALLGSIGLVIREPLTGNGEIGYWLAAGARGRGVGTRAVTLLAHWAIRSLELQRVEILVNPVNEPSQRLAERAGFTREGLLRSYRERKGVREDLIVFSLLPEDLPA